MINNETILSTYDDKLTLLQWLKKVQAALGEAAATTITLERVSVVNDYLAYYKAVITFADNSTIESGNFLLTIGDASSIISSTPIFTSVTAEEVEATTLISTGGASIAANLSVGGNLPVNGAITANSIIENMSGYSMSESGHADYTFNFYYVGAVKNGNKITFSVFGTITKASGAGAFINVLDIYIPQAIGQKLYPVTMGTSETLLDVKTIGFALDFATSVNCPMWLNKISNTNVRLGMNATNIAAGNTYLFRYEVTFLLSDSLA